MGAWSWGAFDNDDALDWCADLESLPETGRLGFVRSTLQTVVDWDGYVPDDTGMEALAAVASIALHRSKDRILYGIDEPPDVVRSLASSEIEDDLQALALRALQRIEARESGWRNHWDGSRWSDDIMFMLDRMREALGNRASKSE